MYSFYGADIYASCEFFFNVCGTGYNYKSLSYVMRSNMKLIYYQQYHFEYVI